MSISCLGAIVGRLSAQGVEGERGVSPGWLLTTADSEVAETTAQLFGGTPKRRAASPDVIDVLLEAETIGVRLAGTAPMARRFVRRDGAEAVHVCDGRRFLAPASRLGRSCGCPSLAIDRKIAARKQLGPEPEVELRLRLQAAPALGIFCLESSSWSLAESLDEVGVPLKGEGSDALLEIRIRHARVSPKSGMDVRYSWPVVAVADQLGGSRQDVAA
ncbi:recombination directionality factor [Streptomyces vinaceus]|uniref:recombination directionality factor n=1 Tax=Streptomyces vinaceus TaxID=1960 RepID=UPI00368C2753